jgi:protein-arginine kinase activator protein McsA
MEQVYRDMCHACDSKLATHHISQPGSTPPSISLCGHCAETHVPSFENVSLDTVRNAGCCFCGGVATSGSISSAEETESRFVCQSCAGESAGLFLAKLAERGLSFQELQALLSLPQFGRIFEDLEGDMRRWVIQRDN